MNLAIIGCGWAGQRHAMAASGAGIALRWLIDADRGRAAALRGQLGPAAAMARIDTGYEDALRDPGTEAVDICLPHDLHASVAVAAAAAGKHVLCEKPLAATLDEADRMIAAAANAGVALMVAENVRFDPVYLKVRALLDAGAIGAPALVQRTRECYLRASFLRDRPWFLDQRAAAGGIMMSGGVHDFALLEMLLGEVESVCALRAPQRFLEMEGDDTSAALLRFRSGVVGTVVESFLMKSLTTASGPEVHTLRIDGALGSLTVGEDRRIRIFSEHPDYLPGGALVEHAIAVPEADTFALELAHFGWAVRERLEPLTSGRAQRSPLACVLAAYRSMASGFPIAVADLG